LSLLTAHDLGLAFGDFDVFAGLSLNVPDDARIGLVGPNGIGKTTLLQVLAGLIPPSSGEVHRAQGRTIGYLRQEAVDAFAARDHSVYAEMLTVFAQVQAHAAALRELEAAMAGGDHGEEMLARYSRAQEAFEREGGYDYEVRIAQVLEGLGFSRAQWNDPLRQLSGGQKTRALLGRLLLEAPDLLILDEPTNHLDVAAVEWLENMLRNWKGALLVVSHDRYFLDKAVDRIWEMSRTCVETYRGNYSAYVVQRQERWERRLKTFEETKERLQAEIELIKRYIGWRKMVEAKGKLKRLTRELLAIEQLGMEGAQGKQWSETGISSISSYTVDEAWQKIKELKPPISRPPRPTMQLRAAARSGTIVLRGKNLRIGYPGNELFTFGSFALHRLECAALIGANGTGKTTFLRTVLGELAPLAGELQHGAGLHIGYFAQAHDRLNPENTVLDELINHKNMPLGDARGHLAQYLFRGEDVYKKVSMLSGGERGRLALAILAVDGSNFLVLDEPTNHLDIAAQEVLQEGLDRFEGTLLLVTHDRYLVDHLATQIWEIRDGKLVVFDGSYQEFLASREREALAAKEQAAAVAEAAQVAKRGSQASQKDARKRAKELSALEARIGEMEAHIADCERRLQAESEAQRYEEVRRLAEQHSTAQTELEALMESWLAMAGETQALA
jgi:ATP-binding cassette subfamily F protein 3